MNKIIQPIAETVTDKLNPIADAAGKLTDKVVQPVAETVTDTLNPITDTAGELTDKVVQPVSKLLTDTLQPVTDETGELTNKVVQPVAETVTDTLKPVTDAAGELTDKVVQPVAKTLIDTLKPVTDAASDLTDKLVQPAAKTVTDTLKPITDVVEELTNAVVQPVVEPQKPFAEDVGVQSVLYLDSSPPGNDSLDKSSTLKDSPLGIIPSPTPLLPVESQLETAGGSYTIAIQSIPKPTPLLSMEKGHQTAIVNSSNKFISAKTSQFPEREPFPTIPLSEPTLPPSASNVDSLLPLPASAKNGKAKSSYAGSDFKAVLIDKSDPMIPYSRMSWHCRIRHYLSWSHAPPLRPPVAPALDY
ncbi:hypothetical protein [Paenibacillus oryzisoli]|uniref:hypothetical protein n=1 Tax=Paenibacillus oryzisoli TaxID=1850517 RepID=UPI00195B40A7|nr:hypothetical protein [Paenibacillus oryzisoli]